MEWNGSIDFNSMACLEMESVDHICSDDGIKSGFRVIGCSYL